MSTIYCHRVIPILLSLVVVLSCSENTDISLIDTGLVYCSEGSPDSFNPHVGTSGTSFDANSRVLFNRLLNVDTSTGNNNMGFSPTPRNELNNQTLETKERIIQKAD